MDTVFREKDGGPVGILVVEDSPTQAEQLRQLLEENGYAVRVAGNGAEALEVLAQWLPTLIISDVVMPELDGYGLCRAVKADVRLKDIPLVFVTSLSGVQDIAASLKCGADNLIRKPYAPQTLLARVDYLLRNLQLRRQPDGAAGMEVYLDGEKRTFNSGRQQMVDLLVSTYQEAVRMNDELRIHQREIARSNQMLAGLYLIADELNQVSTQAEVCDKALQSAMTLPKFGAGWILLADEAGELQVAASARLPAAVQQSDALRRDCHCRRTWRSEDPVQTTCIAECDALNGCGAAFEQHASTPLCVDGRCLGVLNFAARPEESFDEEDLPMLDALGSQVAIALERARLFQRQESLVRKRTAVLQCEIVERTRAQQRVASLNRIHAVLSGINSTIVRVQGRDELFRDVCRIAVDVGGFGLALIGLLCGDDSRLRPVAWKASEEWSEADFSRAVDMDDGPLRMALREKRPIVCRDLEKSGDPFASAALARGYRSSIALSLMVKGRPAGVLALYAREPGVFDAAELRLLREISNDISFALDYLAMAEQVDYLAFYDALTELPNRALLMERVQRGISSAQRLGTPLAVICLDIDRFRLINDGLGHQVGDRLLQEVGKRLCQCVRSGDTVGRLGGDEFAIVCDDLAGEEDLSLVTQRVLSALDAPILLEGESFRLTASVGISVYPHDADDPATLLKNADLAMHQAKQQGRSNHQFFTPDLGARVSKRLQMERRLAQALDRGELELFYQPQVDAVNGAVNGMEALLRWRHPEHGLVFPEQFISIAEESELIVPMGQWVMREACRQNKVWQDEGLAKFPVSVNLSMAQFRDEGLLAGIREVLADTRLPAEFLELEITESMVMDSPETFIAFLNQIKEQGTLLAIDDFGTGYSNLSYLKCLPVDRLKVDYSFVRDIIVDRDSAAVCRAIIAIAHNLRLAVVAEGVETEAQAAYLAQNECDSLQGYYMCRPSPAGEVTDLLRRGALKPPAGRPGEWGRAG